MPLQCMSFDALLRAVLLGSAHWKQATAISLVSSGIRIRASSKPRQASSRLLNFPADAKLEKKASTKIGTIHAAG